MNINDSHFMDEIHNFSNIFEPTPWWGGEGGCDH
jgi:hypothetical protein